jgi:hypothetical protein
MMNQFHLCGNISDVIVVYAPTLPCLAAEAKEALQNVHTNDFRKATEIIKENLT